MPSTANFRNPSSHVCWISGFGPRKSRRERVQARRHSLGDPAGYSPMRCPSLCTLAPRRAQRRHRRRSGEKCCLLGPRRRDQDRRQGGSLRLRSANEVGEYLFRRCWGSLGGMREGGTYKNSETTNAEQSAAHDRYDPMDLRICAPSEYKKTYWD